MDFSFSHTEVGGGATGFHPLKGGAQKVPPCVEGWSGERGCTKNRTQRFFIL